MAPHFPLNHRKRKAPADDTQDPSPDGPPIPDVPPPPSAAPRQPCLPSRPEWSPPSSHVSSPLSGQVLLQSNPTKRPRLQKIQTSLRPLRRPNQRKSPVRLTLSRPPPIARHGSDIEDLGVVSVADPGPSSGSLLHLRSEPQKPASPSSPSLALVSPVDINSTHIPSRHPLINRQTLKELDLDVILCNPQLRHDLLFDPGLQFRPTCSRKKRSLSERYWAAIIQEIETGCTCVSFDSNGKPHPVVCVCTQVPKPPSHPVVAYSSALNTSTLRMPSRICNLLAEFLEVLLFVIQPLSSVSGMYVNPNTFSSQMQEHSAQAAYVRSIFDPALIEQELQHELFDPSGLFCAIGDILKGHCAPMRDRAVELMVHTAQSCAPGGTGTKRDAVAAVRMCMELLELMKLDIANHQLQTLRPFLIRTSGQFELKAFRNRKAGNSLCMTREWLRLAHADMLARGLISHEPSGHLDYRALSRNQQTFLAVLKGLVDLVFDPPPVSFSSPSTPASTPLFSITPIAHPTSPRLSEYPETSYLDNARLAVLGADVSDILAMHMFLLLYRQLVFSGSREFTLSLHDQRTVQDADLIKLKTEIRDIASVRLGSFFSSGLSTASSRAKETELKRAKQDIALQIAKRAKEARGRPRPSSPWHPSNTVPDEHTVSLAQRWVDSNIQTHAPLANMLRHRLRDVVFNFVVAMTYPGRDQPGTNLFSFVDYPPVAKTNPTLQIPPGATGMEPLTEDIRTLSEKISQVALIHLNAFLPLYEQDSFLD